MAGTESAPALTKDRMRKYAVMVSMGAAFTRAKWTAGQARDFMIATAQLVKKSKEERPKGGVESLFESLYETPELPLDLLEKLLSECLRDDLYREVMARKLMETALSLSEGDQTLPYRQWLKWFFADEAKRKEEKPKGDGWIDRGTAWPKTSARHEDEDEEFVG